MNEHYPVPFVPAPTYLLTHRPETSTTCATLANMAVVGAVVGGAAAAAQNSRRVLAEEIDFSHAVGNTTRVAVASGLATAVAGAVAGAVAQQGALRLALMFGVGAATLYAINSWVEEKGGRNV
jgi:hypothetical protein